MPSDRHRTLLLLRGIGERSRLNCEGLFVDILTHEVIVELARAAGAIGGLDELADRRGAADGDLPAAPRPQQDLHQTLDIGRFWSEFGCPRRRLPCRIR